MAFFGGSLFGSTPSPVTTLGFPSGAQATTSTVGSTGFRQSTFGGQSGGSRVAPYAGTAYVYADEYAVQPAERLVSISAMLIYKDKTSEELRWEDYQFGDKGSSIFGQKATFGASSTQGFGFDSTPTFGQLTIAFGGSSIFGTAPSPFGSQSSTAGAQATIPTFGSTSFVQSAFGGQQGGSGVASYSGTAEVDGGSSSQPAGRLVSISAMLVYIDKSSEELRWWDYQFGDKGSSISGQKPVFGASSTPGFGFGFGSTPTFGQSTMALGGSNIFGTISPFGTQSSPSGAQATIPTFGSTNFRQSAFGGQHGGSRVASYSRIAEVDGGRLVSISAMPVYIDKSSEELRWGDYQFGDKGSSISGQKPVFGASSTPGFGFGCGSPPTFGQSTMALGGSNIFGTISPFGTQSSPSGSSIFGQKPAFGASSTPGFGFGFGSTPTSGQSTMAFGGSNVTPSGTQTSPSGAQCTKSTFGSRGFGQSAFGGQYGGSRVASYSGTSEVDSVSGAQHAGRLVSISAMPIYEDKCSEELRWEDYQFGDKGGIGVGTSTIQSNPFSPPLTSGHSTVNPFSSSISLASQTQVFSFPCSGVSTSFSSPPSSTLSSPNSVWTTSAFIPTSLTASAPMFGPNSSPSLCGPSNSPAFTTSPSIFNFTSRTYGHSSVNPFSSSIHSNPFTPQAPDFSFPDLLSTTTVSSPALNTSSSINSFWTTSSCTPSTSETVLAPAFGLNSSPSFFGPSSSPSLASSPFIFSSTSAPGTTFAFGPSISSFTSHAFSSSRSISSSTSITTSVPAFGFNSPPSCFAPSSSPALASSPSIFSSTSGQGTASGVNSNLSSFRGQPSSLFHSLASSHGQTNDLFVPVTAPRSKFEGIFFSSTPPMLSTSIPAGLGQTTPSSSTPIQPAQTTQTVGNVTVEVSAPVLNGSACQDKNGADVIALMPRLRSSNYYSEPRIEELVAKERAEPGFCCHVKDFVVGRHGYGSIKFLGETDVRQLDLESYVKFNNREVIVYMDASKKPPVGQGLNKPAEVTLLNVKCINKKTGKQHIDGPEVDKYKEMLIKKAADEGAEFVSYDPIDGVWKFRVQHFQ